MRYLKFIFLLCIVWHWQYCKDAKELGTALRSVQEQSPIELKVVVDPLHCDLCTNSYIVLWSTECPPKAAPAPTPLPKPTPDWRVMPKKYRTPNPHWHPGDPTPAPK
jgi:hypothetical protein